MSVTVVKAVQTCSACPAQWDAWDSLGRYWYLRYRHGYGEARQYPQGPGWWEAETVEPATEVLSFEFGDSLDGYIELTEFAEKAGLRLELAGYTDYADHLAYELGIELKEK